MEKEELQFSFEQAFNKLSRKPTLFNDERFLDVNFSSEILHRKDELYRLLGYCSDLIEKPGTCSVYRFVIGKSGTGKTSAIQCFSRELVNIANNEYNVPLRCVHVNCRIEYTTYKILVTILRSLKKNFPRRGYSSEELIDILNEYLNDKNIYLLVVLDELDCVVGNNSDILYYLININAGSTALEHRLSIIAILRDANLISNIINDIGLVFYRNHVEFKPYSETQLFDILKIKATKAYKSGAIDDDLIRYVVSLIKQSRDLRRGMNILWKAGKIAESENLPLITKNCVDIANNECNRFSSSSEYLKPKPKHLIRFLLCLKKAKIEHRSNKIYTSDVYKKYCQMCKSEEKKPRSYSQIWNYVKELEKLKILIIRAENNADGRGRKNYLEFADESLLQMESELEKLINTEEDASDN